MKNFALIGAAGFIAPRHLKAIHDTGNSLVAAVDPHDCVGRMDVFFPEARFFTEIERFDRYLEKCRRGCEENRIHYVSICSPNYLHDAHVRMALRTDAHVICEKPLVLSPWNLDSLEQLEGETNCRVNTVLQLRLLPSLIALRDQLQTNPPNELADVCLTYTTRRGRWYDISWKGSQEKSGGLAMNIGIHFFDLLLWLFGEVDKSTVHLNTARKMAGMLELQKARVRWFLSVDEEDLPQECRSAGDYAFRSMSVDGTEIEFSHNFTDLHTQVYEDVLAGKGFGITDARPAIQLGYDITHQEVTSNWRDAHPQLKNINTLGFDAGRVAA